MAEWKCIIIIGWKSTLCACILLISSAAESNQQKSTATGVQHNSTVHLISSNKSDLLLVKTFYLHIHWSISPRSALLLLTSIPKTSSLCNAFEKVCAHVSHTFAHSFPLREWVEWVTDMSVHENVAFKRSVCAHARKLAHTHIHSLLESFVTTVDNKA